MLDQLFLQVTQKWLFVLLSHSASDYRCILMLYIRVGTTTLRALIVGFSLPSDFASKRSVKLKYYLIMDYISHGIWEGHLPIRDISWKPVVHIQKVKVQLLICYGWICPILATGKLNKNIRNKEHHSACWNTVGSSCVLF